MNNQDRKMPSTLEKTAVPAGGTAPVKTRLSPSDFKKSVEEFQSTRDEARAAQLRQTLRHHLFGG